jgi:Phage protein (N4 Gp49/phage Sf6 gene 66) family
MSDEIKYCKKVLPEQIEKIVSEGKIASIKVGIKTTFCMLTLKNGFVLSHTSSCVDPENYDHELGTKLCVQKIKDKLWELEGYKLQCEIYDLERM